MSLRVYKLRAQQTAARCSGERKEFRVWLLEFVVTSTDARKVFLNANDLSWDCMEFPLRLLEIVSLHVVLSVVMRT